jgi:amino acid permease
MKVLPSPHVLLRIVSITVTSLAVFVALLGLLNTSSVDNALSAMALAMVAYVLFCVRETRTP